MNIQRVTKFLYVLCIKINASSSTLNPLLVNNSTYY